MASPTLLTWSQVSPFSARKPPTAATHPVTTAEGPSCELVGCWCSRVEMVVPSAQTPPTLDIVAPQSVPMKTCWVLMAAQHRTDPIRPGRPREGYLRPHA